MRNLDWLYQADERFRETVQQAAADWLGSTSLNFAGAWLMEQHKYEHHDSDYEDLIGQHLDGPCVVPDRFCSDAAKWRISQFVAQETGQTAESDAAKSEIRDFADSREELVDRVTDMVNAKMDERNTGELVSFARRLESAAENGDDVTLFGVDYVPAANAEYLDGWDSSSVADLLHQYEDGKLMRGCDMETHVLIETEELQSKLDECTSIIEMHKRRCTNLQAKLDYLLDERDQLQADADTWRAKCGALLDAAHEMIRIGGDV